MPEWKDTVNLPRTDFPMKANLPTAEPEALARWQAMDLYGKIRREPQGRAEVRAARRSAVRERPDPPRHRAQQDSQGFRRQVAIDGGFRCALRAGLRLPRPADRAAASTASWGRRSRDMSMADFRRACRAYAERFIGVMTEEFKRLGVFGDWDHPYVTMNFRYQAAIARALGRFVEQGLVYKGKKPVHWCIHCRTALAEAEVEYDDHASPSIYVEFPLADESAGDLAARVPALAGQPVSVLIWTTTPWTIPSNLAIAFHPELRVRRVRVEAPDGTAAPSSWRRRSPRGSGKPSGRPFGTPVARVAGSELERLRFRHPLYDRDSLAVLGGLRHARCRHRRGAHGARPRRRRLQHRREVRARDLRAGRSERALSRHRRTLRRPARVRRQPERRARR